MTAWKNKIATITTVVAVGTGGGTAPFACEGRDGYEQTCGTKNGEKVYSTDCSKVTGLDPEK